MRLQLLLKNAAGILNKLNNLHEKGSRETAGIEWTLREIGRLRAQKMAAESWYTSSHDYTMDHYIEWDTNH